MEAPEQATTKVKRTVLPSARRGRLSRKKVDEVVRGVHLLPENGAWKVRRSGKSRIVKVFPEREKALSYAKSLSKRSGVSLIIHRADGSSELRSIPRE
jgi:hypothetical protein